MKKILSLVLLTCFCSMPLAKASEVIVIGTNGQANYESKNVTNNIATNKIKGNTKMGNEPNVSSKLIEPKVKYVKNFWEVKNIELKNHMPYNVDGRFNGTNDAKGWLLLIPPVGIPVLAGDAIISTINDKKAYQVKKKYYLKIYNNFLNKVANSDKNPIELLAQSENIDDIIISLAFTNA